MAEPAPRSPPRAPRYEPPTQSPLGQWIDAAVLMLLVFGALYAPVLLGWTSPAASGTPLAHPTWDSLHQNPVMAAQWEKLGYDPQKAAPLIASRFDYRIDPFGLAATALVLVAYFALLIVFSDREYRQVIEEHFAEDKDEVEDEEPRP